MEYIRLSFYLKLGPRPAGNKPAPRDIPRKVFNSLEGDYLNKIRLGKIGRKYIGPLTFAVGCMVLSVICDAIGPQLTARIFDDVIKGGNTVILPTLLIGLCLTGVGRAFGGYFKEYTFDMVGCSVGSKVRKDLFNHIQTLSLDYFDKTNTGELMARVKDDADRIWDIFGMTGMLTIEIVLRMGMVLYCMFSMNARLALIPLGVMLVMGALAVYMEKRLDKAYDDISERNAELTTVAEENLSGVRTVKAFTAEDYEIDKFEKKNQEYFDAKMKYTKIENRIYPYFPFVAKLFPVFMAVIGGIAVAKGTMSVGYLAAFITYSMDFVWPMEVFGELANEYSMIAASYKKINKIFAEEARIKNAENAITGPVAGTVEFDHVGFTVGEKEILKDITFKVEEGKTLGIMGETGSGKSSIVNLIGRLFDVTEGTVKVGGVDVRELNLTDLRKAIKYVSQETFLFSDSVKDNVRMGERKNIEEDAVVDASKLACADEFVSKMENKYDTIIGERGVGLSGGQKQRISIARAFVRNNPILIMDDSTSALDMETERDIHHALNKIKGTKIIIAHRISAVRYADEIIVLKDGKIAERGTHEELLAYGGLYKETYDSQYGQNLMEVV